MSKQSLSASLKQIDQMENESFGPFIEWLSKNKHNLLLGFGILFIGMVLTYRYVSSSAQSAELDFLQAQADFSQFQQKAGISQETDDLAYLERLEKIVARHPDLQAKYDALVAQLLIIDQDPERAEPFADRTFERVNQDYIKLYQDYAQTSLLVSGQEYEAALFQAQELQHKLKEANAQVSGPTLYVYNLIRLGMLYQQLGLQAEEKQAWNELVQYQGNREAVLTVDQLFREGNLSLSHYVEERLKTLNS